MKSWQLLVVLGFVLLGTWLARDYQQKQLLPSAQAIPVDVPEVCEFNESPCEVSLPGGQPVVIAVKGKPSPLTPFSIELAGEGLRTAEVRFEMKGMDMGVNRARFTPVAPSSDTSARLQAKVILPLCTTQRTDWVAFISLDLAGRQYLLRYAFDLGGS